MGTYSMGQLLAIALVVVLLGLLVLRVLRRRRIEKEGPSASVVELATNDGTPAPLPDTARVVLPSPAQAAVPSIPVATVNPEPAPVRTAPAEYVAPIPAPGSQMDGQPVVQPISIPDPAGQLPAWQSVHDAHEDLVEPGDFATEINVTGDDGRIHLGKPTDVTFNGGGD